MISAITSSATLRVLLKGALKTGTPRSARGVEGHLVRPDAEGPEREQAAGLGKHPVGDLGPAPDPEDVHVADLLEERVFPEGSRTGVELEALLVEELVSARVDVLQQENPDLALGERGLGRGGLARGHGVSSRSSRGRFYPYGTGGWVRYAAPWRASGRLRLPQMA